MSHSAGMEYQKMRDCVVLLPRYEWNWATHMLVVKQKIILNVFNTSHQGKFHHGFVMAGSYFQIDLVSVVFICKDKFS